MTDEPASIDGMHWVMRLSLVERLLIPWEGMGDMANQQRAEAAVQIKTMMDEINEWHNRCAEMLIQRDNAEDERDEARRRLCAELLEVEGHPVGWKGARGAEGIAERLGWDCFKEKP